jgi:hypothetical protein
VVFVLVVVVVSEVFGCVVEVVVLGVDAAAVGPVPLRSPIWSSTTPMITATPMSAAPRNAA